MAHLTLLPPDDPDDDEAVVVFDVFNSSLKFDFITPGFGVLRCCRSKELFSSEMDGDGRKIDDIRNGDNTYVYVEKMLFIFGILK